MNLITAFFICLKGSGISGSCCIPFLELGLRAFSSGILISWIAIPLYAISLRILRKSFNPHKPSMALMLLVPTVSSLLMALCFLQLADTKMVSNGESILFWVPLFCCMLSVTFCANRIYCLLHPKAISEKIIIK